MSEAHFWLIFWSSIAFLVVLLIFAVYMNRREIRQSAISSGESRKRGAGL